nr:MAG TPA: hypothetical protein [Siphoviridae sp. ctX8T1]
MNTRYADCLLATGFCPCRFRQSHNTTVEF